MMTTTTDDDTLRHTMTVLVVGDGDLSYSAQLAQEYMREEDDHGSPASPAQHSSIQLIASVLEERDEHQRVYQQSRHHEDTILLDDAQHDSSATIEEVVATNSSSRNKVLYGVDATRLSDYFALNSLDRIEFNFPHWRGKSNNRYNRQLVSDFFQSASQVLKKGGPNRSEIHIALRHEQSGVMAQNHVEWKLSWMVAHLAAEQGLLLKHMYPFSASYSVSSYRGGDRPFPIGDNPQRYVFGFPEEGTSVDLSYQICYRHELRLMLHPEASIISNDPSIVEHLLNDDIILTLAQEIVPEGIRVEIPRKTRLIPHNDNNDHVDPEQQQPNNNHHHVPLLVYLMVYCGEQVPLTRMGADQIRDQLEQVVYDRFQLPIAKPGRLVSKPFPYLLLSELIRERGL